MITNRQFWIGSVLAAMMLVSMVFVPAVSGHVDENSNKIITENSMSYTEAELIDLYSKYNVTENDLDFANMNCLTT